MHSDTSTTAAAPTDADRALKERHRKMWALGDYPQMVRDFLLPLGERLVDEAGIAAGDRVLDVGAGTGNAAIAAARRGARVVASDLTPELFSAGAASAADSLGPSDLTHELLSAGRARAADEGVELEWVQADAEHLPFADGEFDVVISTIGAMFAPHHEATASELARVCRLGGTVGMINWTPEGVIGDLFRAMGPFMPAPPPGATPPPRWGSEEHVRELFGDTVTDLSLTRDVLPVAFLDEAAAYGEYFKHNYGPTIVAYKNVADDPARVAELDAALARVFEQTNLAPSGAAARHAFEYLVVVARRAGAA